MIQDKRVVALVPIKQHSERVPGKNFRTFCGRPLFERILGTLDRTSTIDEILINTDSPQILSEGESLSPKIRTLERPEELRGDLVSMNRIIAYDLTMSDGDLYLQTHVTNPLLQPATITRALYEFREDKSCDSLFSVNLYRSRFYSEHGTPMNHDPDKLIRTQDLPPIYEENSAIYVFTRASFSASKRRIAFRPRMFPISRMEAIDIDDETTFRLAEVVARSIDAELA